MVINLGGGIRGAAVGVVRVSPRSRVQIFAGRDPKQMLSFCSCRTCSFWERVPSAFRFRLGRVHRKALQLKRFPVNQLRQHTGFRRITIASMLFEAVEAIRRSPTRTTPTIPDSGTLLTRPLRSKRSEAGNPKNNTTCTHRYSPNPLTKPSQEPETSNQRIASQ